MNFNLLKIQFKMILLALMMITIQFKIFKIKIKITIFHKINLKLKNYQILISIYKK